jgi:hypothetical protein
MGIKEEPMKIHNLSLLAVVLVTCALAAPAVAGLSPYVRLDYGGNQLRMTDANHLILDTEALLKANGFPAQFHKVGTGYGPGGSVGLWIFPGFRLGATGAYLRTTQHNRVHVPGQLFYADDVDLRMTEFGGEAAVRIRRLAGLTLGGNVARGRAELIEGYSVEDPFSQFYQDAKAHRDITTYGAFVGIDQTNTAGVAGFIRAGFQFRDAGRMTSQLSVSDGTNTVQATGTTIPLDYSGFYVKVGIGYDRVR